MLHFKVVSTHPNTVGKIIYEDVEFISIEKALAFAELDEKFIKQEVIPSTIDVELRPLDYDTIVALNEHWMRLMYTGKLHRDDNND